MTPTRRNITRKRLAITSIAAACCLLISLSTCSTVDAKPVANKRNNAPLDKKYASYEAIVGSESMLPTFFDQQTIAKSAHTKNNKNTKKTVTYNVKTTSGKSSSDPSRLKNSIVNAKNAIRDLFGQKPTVQQTKSYSEGVVQLEIEPSSSSGENTDSTLKDSKKEEVYNKNAKVAPASEKGSVDGAREKLVEPANEQVLTEQAILDTTTDSSLSSPSASTDSTTEESSNENLIKREDSIYYSGQLPEGVDDEGDATDIPMPDDVHAHPIGDASEDDYDARDPSEKEHNNRPYSSPIPMSSSAIQDVLICISTALFLLTCLLIIVSHRVYLHRRRDDDDYSDSLTFLRYFISGFFGSLYKDPSSLICKKGSDRDDDHTENYSSNGVPPKDSFSTSFSTHGQVSTEIRRTSASQHLLQEQFSLARELYNKE